MRELVIATLFVLWAGAARAADVSIPLTIVNAGARLIACQIIFGHWVTGDLEVIPPGAIARFTLQRQDKDGALFVPRYDGRKMFVENIDCGERGNWLASLGQVPLLAIRAQPPSGYKTSCRAETGRVACSEVTVD